MNTNAILQSAVKNEAAYPVSDYFTEQGAALATDRIERIRSNWRFYLGDQAKFDDPRPDGSSNVMYNYVRCIIDKSIRWLANPKWSITALPGNERTAEFYETIWQRNQKRLLFRQMAIQGGISGDSYVWVGVNKSKKSGEKGADTDVLRLRSLNSANVHPVIDPMDPTRMLYCVIQYPVHLRQKDMFRGTNIKDPAGTFPLAVYTQVILPDVIYEYVNDTLVGQTANVGFVNIVHVPNLVMGGASFGRDEANDLKKINLSINHVATDLKQIVSYYASPLTLVYGVGLGDIARQKNTVWSNIPVESRIESLEQKADLAGSLMVMEGLVQQMHELGNTPRGSLSSEQVVSNVSEAALRVFFMPLLEVLEEKYDTYGDGVNRINKMIGAFVEKWDFDLKKIAGKRVNPLLTSETFVKFSSPIPKDATELINAVTMKVKARLQSRASALRDLGTENPENEALEIISDIAEEMYETYQSGQAALGVPVSYSGVAVGSLGKLSGAKKELEDIAKLIQSTESVETLVDTYQQSLVAAGVEIPSPETGGETSQPSPTGETPPNPEGEGEAPQKSVAGKVLEVLQQLDQTTQNLTAEEKSRIVTMVRHKLER